MSTISDVGLFHPENVKSLDSFKIWQFETGVKVTFILRLFTHLHQGCEMWMLNVHVKLKHCSQDYIKLLHLFGSTVTGLFNNWLKQGHRILMEVLFWRYRLSAMHAAKR
ncbi:hypothetical protein XENOCAPTIV_012952 [Xenoophorus captivus]|uniref:Uncharacterized protein n=1 Tax=Xenoophorus captivus TaxID=1517983 RepID=A0ABV0Q9Q1_9TELE